jgi:hypothetical protein
MKVCSLCGKSNVEYTKESVYNGKYYMGYTYLHNDGTKCRGYISYKYSQEESNKEIKFS